MSLPDLRTNPDALPDAPAPRVERVQVDGTSLYVEVRGAGPAVLLVPGGAEDAEGWRPIAERLTGLTVVTYDRRGTLRSGRRDWPGGGSAQHGDDAAGMLRVLGLDDVVVFGGSSGANVALALALRHPRSVRRALLYEPGFLRQIPGGEALQGPVSAAVADHLAGHPADWAGAYAAFVRAVSQMLDSGPSGFLATPPGKGWYAAREEGNAEAFLRDDVPILTRERVDEARLASAGVDIRLSFGSASLPIFRGISTHLAAILDRVPEVIEGVGHTIYLHPAAAASYIQRWSERA